MSLVLLQVRFVRRGGGGVAKRLFVNMHAFVSVFSCMFVLNKAKGSCLNIMTLP